MKHTNVKIAKMMDRSISHQEVVFAPWSSVLATDLAEACEGSATEDTDRSAEYWGTWEDDDGVGHEWRIHLTRAVA
jgi:hypothetical protein